MNLFFNFFSTFLLTFSGRLDIIFLTVVFLAVDLPQRAAAGERKVHKMKGLGYFERLSLAARWFLPREEAQGVIEDYRDILREVEGPEEAVKRFGTPGKLARGLADRKEVRRWYLMLVLMLFCLFSPFFIFELDRILGNALLPGNIAWYNPCGNSNLGANFLFAWVFFFLGIEILEAGSYKKPLRTVLLIGLILMTFFCFSFLTDGLVAVFRGMRAPREPYRVGPNYFINLFSREDFQFVIGALASFAAFGFGGKWKKPLSKPLLFSLIGAFVLAAVPGGFLLYSAHVNVYPLAYHLGWVKWGTVCLYVVLVLGALASLALARMWDPRWRSVLILCMAGLAVCYYLHGIGSTQHMEGMVDAFYLAQRHKIWLEEVDKLVYPCVGIGAVLAGVGLL